MGCTRGHQLERPERGSQHMERGTCVNERTATGVSRVTVEEYLCLYTSVTVAKGHVMTAAMVCLL